MPEAARLEHLFRGLKPSLLEKIYPLKPTTCADFLAHVKIYAEASILANRRTWSESVLGASTATVLTEPVTFVRTAPKPPPATPDQDIWKILRDLQVAVEELKNRPSGLPKNVRWGKTNQIPRSPRGSILCGFCNKSDMSPNGVGKTRILKIIEGMRELTRCLRWTTHQIRITTRPLRVGTGR